MSIVQQQSLDTNITQLSVSIRPYSDGDAKAWDDFVTKTDGGTFFHLSGWPRVIEKTYGHKNYSLIAIRNNEICGVLPLNYLKTPLFGASLISTAFTVGGGILAMDEEAAGLLSTAAIELGKNLSVDYVELRSSTGATPECLKKSETYAGFVKALPMDEDENLKMIPRKKRADLRKGLKSNLHVDATASVDAVYKIYSTSVRNLGTPVFPKLLLQNLIDEFGNKVELSVIHDAANPVASLVSFYFKDRVMPYYGGALPEARSSHAYDFQYWKLMRRAVERGIYNFDFGRSKCGTGAYAYKTYWGFEPALLTYQYHLIQSKDIPDVNPMNPKYKMMVSVWRRLPLPVANFVGPFIAGQLG